MPATIPIPNLTKVIFRLVLDGCCSILLNFRVVFDASLQGQISAEKINKKTDCNLVLRKTAIKK
jgi:hypothetical protein